MGIFLHDAIPKQWKLSDTNKNNFQNFLNYNEFLSHYETFIPLQEKNMNGYYQYQKEKEFFVCFQGMFTYVKSFFQGDYNTIIGNDKNDFNEELSNIFNRFNFLMLFSLMIDYIEELSDDESSIASQANYLFTLLEVQKKITQTMSIELCTKLFYDLLFDHIEAFIDTNWIYQTNKLTDKLSKQKEREKQTIIDSLESKTEDARLVTVQMQNHGLSNYYHSATDSHLSHINSKEYSSLLENERAEHAKELFNDHQSEIEVAEKYGIDTSLIFPKTQIEKEDNFYPQIDSDREHEGDDDEIEGNYKEN